MKEYLKKCCRHGEIELLYVTLRSSAFAICYGDKNQAMTLASLIL